ncbi:hypothetical protein DFH27DRAFT_616116 [Peziza echinospora]|nr:hypothetical protein DFH27DRAFT_616116 [Peziza echinospora]
MIQTTETAPPTVAQWPSELTNAGVFMDLQDITADISRHTVRVGEFGIYSASKNLIVRIYIGSHVNNTEEIENALLESSDASIRFIFISQPYSWARLNITEECLRATLSILKVMPEFWYILRAFGSKNEPIDESFGGFYEAVGEENAELCYLVKHVEENKRDEVLPWSNRQVGVYQQTHLKSDGLTHSNTFIIVNPSRNCCKLLEQLCSKQEQYHNAETVHTIVASSLTAQWKAYINCSESKLLKFNGMNMATSNELKDLNYVDFKLRDAQYAYDMRDSILQVLSLLQINLVVFPKVQRLCKAHRQRFQNAITEMELQQKRLEVVLNRVIASIALFENIMESRAASRIKENVEELRKQGWLAKDQAAKALEDARTVKALTFLAMAFIPPTFASQVLGMGFITVDDHPRRWELHFSAELVEVFNSLESQTRTRDTSHTSSNFNNLSHSPGSAGANCTKLRRSA